MIKTALFVFNGDPVCFIHVLLNAMDMRAKGFEARIVVEGAATGLVPKLVEEDHPLHALWSKARAAGLVEGVCLACSQKMGTLDAVRDQGLPLLEDMNGHPGMAGYRLEGWEVVTF